MPGGDSTLGQMAISLSPEGGGGLKRVADSLAAPLLVTGRASRIPADIRYSLLRK